MILHKEWIKLKKLFLSNDHATDKNNPHGVTASQAGAVAKTGDTMTGNLNGTNVYLSGALGVGGKKSTTDAATGIVFGKTGNITMQGDSAPAMNFLVGSGTAAKGRVAVDTSNTRLDSYQTPGSINGMRGLRVAHAGTVELRDALMLVVNEASYYGLYGLHNKPVGTYTGNGDSTSRDIACGIGSDVKMIFVTSKRGVAWVTQTGTLVLSSGTVSGLKYAEGYYAQNTGKMTLATTSIFLNEEGTEYKYQSL